jgi:hypothetical protein
MGDAFMEGVITGMAFAIVLNVIVNAALLSMFSRKERKDD